MATPSRHFTATTFVVADARTLLLWHRKSQAWFPPGGHIEPDELPEEAALREVREETGLQVELLGERLHWGSVRVLTQPVCMLLENIRAGHQHIDLIYFARVTGGTLRVDPREAADHRWYDATALEAPQIAPDIRILGLRALRAVAVSRPPDI